MMTETMQLHYLHFFIQAVECKSLNRAARKLDISPQRLSSGVASLEKALGYSLLVRSPYGVYPTEKGLIVYEDAVKFADIYNKWLNMASSGSHRTHSINVKIGASTALMRWLVPQVMVEVNSKYPHISLSLFESYVEEVFLYLIDQHIVGAITGINELNAPSYRVQLMQNDMLYEEGIEDNFVVVINKDHPLAKRKTLNLGDLANFQLVFNPQRDKFFIYKDIFKWFKQEKIINIPEQENLLRLIAMDKSMATVLPQSAILYSDKWTQELAPLYVEDFPMPGNIWLIYPEKMISSEKIVLESFRKVLQNMSNRYKKKISS